MIKEKTKRQPRPRQIKAAKAVVENMLKDKPLPTGQVLESIGYGTTSQTPSVIIESEGFQTALQDTGLRAALAKAGINPKKIADKINVLLDGHRGEDDDYQAIDKGLKHATAIYGITEDSEKQKGNTYNFLFSSDVQGEVKKINDVIKAKLINHVQEDN